MTPRRARLWQVPRLACILWAGGVSRRSWRVRLSDLRLLLQLVLLGQVSQVPGRLGPRGFIIRDGVRIHALYTHPRAKRQGVASRLLREAQGAAQRLELWTAQDNGPARAFYAAHGFYPAALSYGRGNDDGVPDMQMVWERSAP